MSNHPIINGGLIRSNRRPACGLKSGASRALGAWSLVLAFALGFATASAPAQTYSIGWHKVAGGGGRSSGGSFSVSGTAGQHDASGALSGGNNSLTGGFWAIYAANPLVYMPFFDNQASLGNSFYYLAATPNNPFGYYSLTFYPYVYHLDLGFEYFFDAQNSDHGAYLYDFTSEHFWYTSPNLFPYLYDFNLTNWLYCFPILDSNGNQTGRYYTNPRIFHDFNTGQTLFF